MWSTKHICPTPCGSRQVVNQAGKLMQIGKFSELMQWQHSHMTKSRTEHGSIHNPLSCHRQASQPTQDNQTRSKNTKTNKPNTTQKTARPVISRSVHGHLKRIRRDDSIVSPLGLVWHVKTRANQQQHDNAIQICEPGSNNGTMRKPRLPTARSLEITECRPHGQHSHRFWTPSKSQQWHCHVAKGQWKLTIVKRSVKTDLGWNDRSHTGTQRPLRFLSGVLCLSPASKEISSAHEGHHGE